MANENIGGIFSTVSVNLQQLSKPIANLKQGIRDLGKEFTTAGIPLRAFGDQLATTLGIALRWYVAYRLLRSVFGGIGEAFANIKKIQIEEVFAKTVFAGQDMTEMLKNVSVVAQKWGYDIANVYSLVTRFSRSLGVDLKTALYLASEAMITARASGTNLDEAGRSIIGMIYQLNGKLKDTIDFLDRLYASAYLSDVEFNVMKERAFGATDGMDNITDATERALTPMKKFGLTNTQIAAIMGVMITRLDQSGQSIGGYTAKLLSALVGNENIRRAFRDVGVDLLNATNKWDAFVAGMNKMNQAQREFVDRQLRIGIGVEVAMNFTDMLNQVNERAIKIEENLNQRREKAAELMETLAAKQDQLRVASQALGLAYKDNVLPAVTEVTKALTHQIVIWGAFIEAINEYNKELKERKVPFGKVIFPWGDILDKWITEYGKKMGDYENIIEEGKKNAEEFGAGLDKTSEPQKEVIVTQTELNDKIKEFDQLIRIADYSLGIFATEQEKNAVKAELLSQKIDFLNKFVGKMESSAAERTLSLELAEAKFQLEQISTHYGNIVELAEKLANATYEGKATLEDLVKKSRQLASQFEDISVTGIRGLIDKTKTWRDILADIGDVVLEEIIRKLVRISIGAEAPGGGLLGSIAGIVSLLGMFGGVKTATPATTAPMMNVTLHKGGSVADELAKLPRFQWGGEVLGLLKKSEYVVREGPAQKYKGLLEYINRGGELGGGGQNVTYYIYAVDARSFQQLLYENKASVHGIVQEASRVHKVGFRNMEG